jgi:hypothetical protein
MHLNIREILNLSHQEVLSLPTLIDIVYDDKVKQTSTKNKLIYSNYFWDIFRQYPNAPLLLRHHVDSVLKGSPLTSGTHIKLLERIYKDVVSHYHLDTPAQKEPIWTLIYKVTNNIHNEITRLSEAHVSSIDILDFVDIVRYEPIRKSIGEVNNTDASIATCYDEVTKVLMNDPLLKNNALVKAIRAKTGNLNQVLQCVVVRGRTTEVDGSIMPTAITSSFTSGLSTLYEMIAESRSAAKSLYFSDSKLKDAEYFARRIQLLAMVIQGIEYIDCGSTRYVEWRIKPPEYDEHGVKTYDGDQQYMSGKYYLADDGVTLKSIGTTDDPSIYNKVIKMRSVLYCTLENPHNVCEVCFGRLAKNVSSYANLGHLSAATMTQQTTQSVLSIKHLDFSSSGSDIRLTEETVNFFNTNRAKNAYVLRKELKGRGVKLIVNTDEVIGLNDVLNIDINNISPIRISAIESIEISYLKEDVEHTSFITVSQNGRKVVLTKELLLYLKEHKWTTNVKNNFVFDMSNWNFTHPVMFLPEVEYSFSDHATMIARVIESNMKNAAERARRDSPVSTLQELFMLVNSKISVSISALEVLIYSTMITSENDYSLGRSNEEKMLGVAELIIKNRSLGAAYAYEDIFKTLISPRSFFREGRTDSVFDAFLMPNEYVKNHKS